jgi:hypothetical protein
MAFCGHGNKFLVLQTATNFLNVTLPIAHASSQLTVEKYFSSFPRFFNTKAASKRN